VRNYLNLTPLNKKLKPIFSYNSYFFNLNKWPIDKAPKVSNSSYLVGFGFLFLFHSYAYPSLDNFVFFTYNWFTFNFQLTSIFFLVAYFLTFRYNSFFFFTFFLIFCFFFFFFGSSVKSSRFYKRNFLLTSSHLVINWDALLFSFFFIGWVFKIAKKYSLESYTLQESFFYKTALPSVYLFEVFTFSVALSWRYLNGGLMGYSTIMYLKYYKFQFVASILITKLFFFIFVYSFFFFLLNLLKQGSRLYFFFSYFFLFLVLTVFLFKEFNELWGFLHQVAPSNLLKFTYFKFFFYLLFFNFLHAYLVVGFSLLGFLIYLTKFWTLYSDFYDIIYINIKNFYLIMWLTVFAFLSIYLIHDLNFYFYGVIN
jgi:hypothetical protein